jgi:hypothetical protein
MSESLKMERNMTLNVGKEIAALQRLIVGHDLDRHKGGGGIALLQFTPPGVEAGLCDVVACAERSNR